MDIKEILEQEANKAVSALKRKQLVVPSWEELKKAYDPLLHPVMTDPSYNDLVTKNAIEKVSRITLDFQRLAVKRMTELCFGIPVKRIYSPENERQREVVKVIENIYQRNRIDSVNIERGNMLFASCEFMTLWYAIEERNNIYGIDSDIKVRCKSYSPMNGDRLYPLFDENGDYVAMSIEYDTKDEEDKQHTFFDTYTAETHIKWEKENGSWKEIIREEIKIGKNPTLYCVRRTPIWENTSGLVYEIEWTLSRNGNYLRKNSKPVLAISADKHIVYGDEKPGNTEFRSIVQVPQGGNLQYVTWGQATDNLKFYIEQLRNLFFMELQLPDWSYENMKSTPMSGEARKQLFIDSQLKVKEEAGRLEEILDKEVNVVKAFVKSIMPSYAKDIDALQIECEIKPFSISDEKELIDNLVTATGGKAIISRKEAIEYLGWSNDSEATLKQIAEESNMDNQWE